MTADFTGRRILITGASQGLGRACAERFAAGGASVVGTWHGDRVAAERAQAELHAQGKRVQLAESDLGNGADSERLWADYGTAGFDVLVLNAAFQRKATVDETDPELLAETLNINVVGNFRLAKRFIAERRAVAKPGAIVVHSSNQAEFVNPSGFAYALSKAALNHLVRHLARATVKDRIRVNGVILGWFDTDGERRFYTAEQISAQAASGIPLGRAGRPEEAAELTAFLAGDSSSYMTGSLVRLDGGFALDPDLGT